MEQFAFPQSQPSKSASSPQIVIDLEEWSDEETPTDTGDLIEISDDSDAEEENRKVEANNFSSFNVPRGLDDDQDSSARRNSVNQEEDIEFDDFLTEEEQTDSDEPAASEVHQSPTKHEEGKRNEPLGDETSHESSQAASSSSQQGLVILPGSNMPYFKHGALANVDYSLPPKDFYFGLTSSGAFVHIQYAYLILRESRRAMTTEEIYGIAAARKWYYSEAQHPHNSLTGVIQTSLRSKDSLFVDLKVRTAFFGLQELMPYVYSPASSEYISSAPFLPPLNPIFVHCDHASSDLIQVALNAPTNQKLGSFFSGQSRSRKKSQKLLAANAARATKPQVTKVTAVPPASSSSSDLPQLGSTPSEIKVKKIIEEAEQIHWNIPNFKPTPAEQKPAKPRKSSRPQLKEDIYQDFHRRNSGSERSETPLAKRARLSSTFESPAPSLASSSSSSSSSSASSRSSSISVSQFEVPNGSIGEKYVSLERDISNAIQAAQQAAEELQHVRELEDSSFSISMDFGTDDSSNDTKEFGDLLCNRTLDAIERELTNRQLFEALQGFRQKRSSQSLASSSSSILKQSSPTYIVPQLVPGLIFSDGFNAESMIVPAMLTYAPTDQAKVTDQ